MGYGWVLVGLWLGIGWVVSGLWLGCGWAVIGYWLGYGWVMVGYWLGYGWVLVGLWKHTRLHHVITVQTVYFLVFDRLLEHRKQMRNDR